MVYKVLNNVVLSRAKNLAASNFGRFRQTTVMSEIDFSPANIYTSFITLCSLHAAISICSYRSKMESHRNIRVLSPVEKMSRREAHPKMSLKILTASSKMNKSCLVLLGIFGKFLSAARCKRYQHQKYLVLKAGSQAHSHKLFKILTKIKHNLFLMNNAIDLFNDIFGWTTLLNIFLGSVRILLHMDKTITKDTSVYLSNNPASIWNMLYQTTLLLIIWSGVIANVLLCDSVVQKHVQLLVLVTQLETNYQGVPSANEQLNSLLNTIAHLRPKFEAARFFSVDKTTLFTVSYSISAQMDLQIIETIFSVGKFTALTPSSTKNHNPHWWQKLYEVSIFLVYVVSFILTASGNNSVRATLTSIQFGLIILYELNQFINVSYILIVMMRVRRSLWFRLIESLAGVQSGSRRIPLKLIFAMSQLIYCGLITLRLYTALQHADLTRAILGAVTCYQQYTQFFYMVVTPILLILLLSRYEHLRETLSQVTKARSQLHSKQIVDILKKLKNSILTLNEAVEIFNDIFGWTILFNIVNGSSRILIYLDVIIKKIDISTSLFYDACFILITWSGILLTILLCDSILKKCDEILEQTYRLETVLTSYENEEIQGFIDALLHNRPEFKAARFFSIDRSTLFSVLNSLTTFLLVMIQFKET
ncbi:hypothetical protein GEV33_009411 [Tenebrio molitor]|uniref:Gustatory receptor n=1 Tax=Tenebrio molitor TaxID=7067 RepID=A0A8J6L9N6_TENMO|nr:hypothetical protein GEV33_009411 [Tenebrio molitor]